VASPTSQTLQTSTPTLAVAPSTAAPAYPEVFTSSLTVAWTNGGNPPGTHYLAQISNQSDYGVVVTSITENESATFTGLLGNSSWYIRLRAIGHDGRQIPESYVSLPATYTLTSVPDAPGFTSASSDAVTAAFTPAGSVGFYGSEFLHQISTDSAFGSVKASSVRKMGEIIDNHPDEALAILRGWMADASS